VNGRVWTGDPARPWAEAVFSEEDRIAGVGSSAEVMKRARGAEVIDARGLFVAPGFIDSHIHFLAGGLGLSSVKLRDASTPAEFTKRIRGFASTRRPGVWIRNGDWDHERWGGELPRRQWIDADPPDK